MAERDVPRPIWEHIEELAQRLKVIFYSVAISSIIFMVLPADMSFLENPFDFYNPLIGKILQIIRDQVMPEELRLIAVGVVTPIELYLIASVVFGVIVSSPVIVYEFYKYIDPALYPHERRMVWGFMAAFLGLFAFGSAFGYFFVARFLIWAMMPFFEVVGAEPIVSIMDFYYLVFITVLMTGLTFTAPAVFVLLVRLGLISTESFTKNRRYIYAGLFIVTAIITPDGGPIADIVLFLPILILMEAAVLIAKRYESERRARLALPSIPIRKCPYCGADIPVDVRFCPECGRALE